MILERGGHPITKHLDQTGHDRPANIDREIETYLDSAIQFGTVIANGWADRIFQNTTPIQSPMNTQTRGNR
ncbi:MAG: hypothetical protein FKY71_04565 [Spiribacter salinus]|uniref:Uncharacterized protein n=1 Tax=Spiribacter salinus TaxID=1335746 RepID=A0A540VTU9_9GAMM|nr:MAG: hypothetical protein FKY71_04565 [Spiribacter salinus]